jgi:hypothetical protein
MNGELIEICISKMFGSDRNFVDRDRFGGGR